MYNNTSNYSVNDSLFNMDHSEFDVTKLPVVKIFIIAMYVIVIIISICINLLVLILVAKQKPKNITTIFIANLAVSDIGLCAFGLPVQLHY